MPGHKASDPLEVAIVNLNQVQEYPVKSDNVATVLALSGIGYALVAIAEEMRKRNV
jgi:hypothetical protein